MTTNEQRGMELDARIENQNVEFHAVDALAKQWHRIQLTPVVDDDYPEVRHGYESAVRNLIEAFKRNGRL